MKNTFASIFLSCFIVCSTIAMEQQQPTVEQKVLHLINQKFSSFEEWRPILEQSEKQKNFDTLLVKKFGTMAMTASILATVAELSLIDHSQEDLAQLKQKYAEELILFDMVLKKTSDTNFQATIMYKNKKLPQYTPLMHALNAVNLHSKLKIKEYPELIERLIPFSNLSIQNNEGDTAFLLAKKWYGDSSKITQLIEKHHYPFLAKKALAINNGIIKNKLRKNLHHEPKLAKLSTSPIVWPNVSNLQIPLKTNVADKNKNTTQNR